jgi:DnaJ-class molecular chaperone
MNEVEECQRCLGGGRIANSEAGEAWKYWQELPPGSDLAVRLGIVFPIDCPACNGTGRRQSREVSS